MKYFFLFMGAIFTILNEDSVAGFERNNENQRNSLIPFYSESSLSVLSSEEAFEQIADSLGKVELGRRVSNYRLRDWGVSRQRYWGCPIPMIHCPQCGVVAVPEEDLPVILPTQVKFEGVQSPLVKMDAFLNVRCPDCGEQATRETDTFDTGQFCLLESSTVVLEKLSSFSTRY